MSQVLTELSSLYSSSELYGKGVYDLIEKYGGKTASLIYQHKNGNHKYLHPFSVAKIQNGGINNFTGGEKIFEDGGNKWNPDILFRSSAIGDQIGLIDRLPTKFFEIGNTNFNTLISEMLKIGKSDDVNQYAKLIDGIQNYNGLSSIIMTPEIQNKSLGSIVSHPNIEGHFVISFLRGMIQFLTDDNGVITSERTYHNERADTLREGLPEIIEMKKQTDAIGFLSSDISTQTEFALRNKGMEKSIINRFNYNGKDYGESTVLFLQQRYFRRNNFNSDFLATEYNFNSFGKYGKEIKVLNKSETRAWKKQVEDFFLPINIEVIDIGTLLDIFECIDSKYCKGIKFKRNGGGGGMGSLEHGCYRFMAGGRELEIRTD